MSKCTCDDENLCDECWLRQRAEHAYLRNTDPRFVFAQGAEPASDFEFAQELNNRGYGDME
jgi:hypothetical protein